MRVNGIEQDYHIIPVPNAPEGISGIINLRGAVIPVYSLREHIGMEPHIDNPEKILLVTNSHGILLAYEVDCVEEIEEVPDSKISLMPSVASNEDTAFMEQVLQIGNEIIITINVDKVLSEDVRQMVDQIVEENQ